MQIQEAEDFVYLDLRGLSCPFPLLKTKKALEKSKRGTKLHVAATDPNTVDDFTALANHGGIKIHRQWQENAVFNFLVEQS